MSNWAEKLQPLFEKYGGRKHPLNYENPYQFLVMIILAAQTTDNLINKIAPEFFRVYPSISDLKNSSPEDLHPLLKSVLGFRKKAVWLVEMAKQTGDDSHIPSTISELTKLPGVGRKTANALIREMGGNAEGIMVDLHVARVAPRLGIVTSENPDKVEKQLMEALPREMWNDTGMVLSFHGREICRPKPKCEECIVNPVCNYYQNILAGNK